MRTSDVIHIKKSKKLCLCYWCIDLIKIILFAILLSLIAKDLSSQREKTKSMSAQIETLETRVAGLQTMTCPEFITPTKRPKSWLIKK